MIDIRTRGDKIDYSFLLTQKAPKIPDSDYKSDLEYPTCILEKTEKNKIYLFLSGIPSERKDWRKRNIFYDLVINSDDKEESKKLAGLIWMWLEDVRKALKKETSDNGKKSKYVIQLPVAGESELGKLLDKKFPTPEIEKLLELTQNGQWTDEDEKKLDDKLKAIIFDIKSPDLDREGKEPEPWWGGVNNDDSCRQWITLVKELLEGEKKGKAFLLNGGTDVYLKQLFKNKEILGVLLDREWSNSPPKPIKPKQETVKRFQLTNQQENDMNQDSKKKENLTLVGITFLTLLLAAILAMQVTLFLKMEKIEKQLENLNQNQIETLNLKMEEIKKQLENLNQNQIETLNLKMEDLEKMEKQQLENLNQNQNQIETLNLKMEDLEKMEKQQLENLNQNQNQIETLNLKMEDLEKK